MNTKKKRIVGITGLVLLLTIFVAGGSILRNMGALDTEKERMEKFGGLPYYSSEGDVFVSPEELKFYPERTTGGNAGFGRFFKKSPNAPTAELPKVMLKKKDFAVEPSAYAFYWLGHSSAILELDGVRMLIDPVLENAAPFPGIVRRYTASPIKRGELPDIDAVLITHDHYDHLEMATIRSLKNSKALFVCPLGLGARLYGWGIPKDRITELGWAETAKIGPLQITSTPGVHYSGRGRSDRNKTLWTGYAIKGTQKNVFWSGDSGYGEHFKQIGEQYGPFDLACVEIDGWNPGWPNTHLFPEEVISVCKDVNAKKLLPVHWGVFDLALHPWDESIRRVAALATADSLELISPIMGERIVPGETPTRIWW
ncbi:MAG: MBL fold metallo-hydrolase [Capnocytophaga sp.]|nr:MBL fold metallo-hydrolase [Capnocytophaga sp.]